MRKPVLLAIQNDETDPPHLAGEWLRELGFEIEVLRAFAGENVPLTVPDHVAALMPLGGHMNANDHENYPFLISEKTLIADAVSRDIPIFAICLGAQLLAEATGGKVDKAPIGEIGVYEIELNSDALHDAILERTGTVSTSQWHEDVVTNLPPGATLLASSQLCMNQIFRIGRNTYGFQSHPEIDHVIVKRWESDADNAFLESGKTSVESEVKSAESELKRTWKPIIQRWGENVITKGAK